MVNQPSSTILTTVFFGLTNHHQPFLLVIIPIIKHSSSSFTRNRCSQPRVNKVTLQEAVVQSQVTWCLRLTTSSKASRPTLKRPKRGTSRSSGAAHARNSSNNNQHFRLVMVNAYYWVELFWIIVIIYNQQCSNRCHSWDRPSFL